MEGCTAILPRNSTDSLWTISIHNFFQTLSVLGGNYFSFMTLTLAYLNCFLANWPLLTSRASSLAWSDRKFYVQGKSVYAWRIPIPCVLSILLPFIDGFNPAHQHLISQSPTFFCQANSSSSSKPQVPTGNSFGPSDWRLVSGLSVVTHPPTRQSQYLVCNIPNAQMTHLHLLIDYKKFYER